MRSNTRVRLRRMLVGSLATALLFLAIGAGSAWASTVRYEVFGSTAGSFQVFYQAAAGETNNVTVSFSPGGQIQITDAGVAAITDADGPGGCSTSANTATCPTQAVQRVHLALGNQNDTVTWPALVPARIDAGDGNDVLNGSPLDDASIFGDQGDDQIFGNAGDDPGLIGDGVITGSGNDTISGGEGSDTMFGGIGADNLDGGTGNDSAQGGLGTDVLVGGPGTDTADYSERFNNLRADLEGDSDDGEVSENDALASDFENLNGGQGDDALTGNDADNRFSGGGGNDIVVGAGGVDTASLADGNDSFDGGAGFDSGSGDDGDDTLTSGPGGSSFSGGNGNDSLTGGPERDTLFGGDGNDGLAGGPGADDLSGDAGNDGLGGQEGPDFIAPGTGADVVSGGPQRDRVTYDERTASVAVDLEGDPDDGEAGEGDRVDGDVENIAGGTADDRLTGNGEPNSLEGGAGNDALDGTGGDDALFGGTGNDAVGGGPGDDFLSDGGAIGADLLSGGEGIDSTSYLRGNASVRITLGGGNDDGEAGEGDFVGGDVENVETGSGNDTIVGNDGPNDFSAGGGADSLAGGGGPDSLSGGNGDDLLDGGAGSDGFFGDAGADRLLARDGAADDATCGASVDSVVADLRDRASPDCEAVSVPALTVSSLRVSPGSFRAARSGGSVGRGTTVSYRLSEAATVTFTVERAVRRGRFAAVRGSFSHRGRAGSNRFGFTGRVGGRALAPGTYRLVAVASAGGRRSRPARAGFRIVR